MKKILLIAVLAVLVALPASASARNKCDFDLLDYNGNGKLDLSDAVKFTHYWFSDDVRADVTGNSVVNRADMQCAQDGYSDGALK